ncbi:uncharacterized protein LOC117228626 [Megalopta genalis]|uniref:uncharacterized protein LOC117228626 n=1 Tax=Megalopta genalis TaxID=115081 RepID=UPI001443541F|nr:putative uncharacterized protein DDB_G0277255 [Megalopta genalis]XP_033340366.1 putative uncharacterized protein DDB_G0277255 [Megalopta genalis]XP_033340367.1 putative uncharacterized protein DDB_G0277255 [Megalopta genalis]XP_033340368.1 putative uncharacterized protein DDB_G0277255 [Megalopta genalis]
MKGIVAVCLLLSVAEGSNFWRQWRPQHPHPHQYPGLPHQHPGPPQSQPCQPFEPPGQICPPGQVHSCSPLPQSQFPPVRPPTSFPLPGVQPGDQNTANWYQQTSNMNSIDLSKAEWVCQNPITKDTMIIISANTQPSETGQGQNPGEGPNINENNNHGNPNDGNLNNDKHNHNVNTTPQSDTNEPSRSHGGEGLIDVRLGP